MILESLPISRLFFDMATLDEAEVPVYKGDTLRMALLWWLSEYWCTRPERCRTGCQEPHACLFGRLIEPPVDPSWSPSMQRLIGETPSPAYALWDNQDRRRLFAAGARWNFELTLIGELAQRQIPAVVAAVQQGAERGMGRIRLRSRVREVTALLPSSETKLATEQPAANGAVLTWENLRAQDVGFNITQVNRLVETLTEPVHAISLRFLSPLKIKEQGQWVDRLELNAIMRALVRRLRILSLVHGAGEWPHELYGPLLDLAETVRLEHDETRLAGFARYSQRSGEQEVEGLVGQAWYGGADLRHLLPILWLGQWLQIGKAYVVGGGRYELKIMR